MIYNLYRNPPQDAEKFCWKVWANIIHSYIYTFLVAHFSASFMRYIGMPCLSPHDPSLIVIAHIWTWGLWRLHPTEIIRSVRIGPETLSEKTANPRYIRTPRKKKMELVFKICYIRLYLWKDCEPMIGFQSWDHDISGPPKKQAWKTTNRFWHLTGLGATPRAISSYAMHIASFLGCHGPVWTRIPRISRLVAPMTKVITCYTGWYMVTIVTIWLIYGYYMVTIWLLYGYYMVNDG